MFCSATEEARNRYFVEVLKISFPMRYTVFFSLILVLFFQVRVELTAQSSSSYFSATSFNDIYYFPDQTDYYFTNGIEFELATRWLAGNPLNKLLIPSEGASQYGLQFIHNIYTPIEKDTTAIIPGDRPFAAYLTISSFRQQAFRERQFRIRSELQLGVIGPASGGAKLQNIFHIITPQNKEVAGWVNQIHNGLIINYNLLLEKGLVETSWLRLKAHTRARLGSLYTDISPGIRLDVGRLFEYFAAHSGWSIEGSIHFSLFGQAELRLVGYDATLHGSWFHPDKRYRNSVGIKRAQIHWASGAQLTYGKALIQFSFAGYSPEFKGGLDHNYGWIKFQYMW